MCWIQFEVDDIDQRSRMLSACLSIRPAMFTAISFSKCRNEDSRVLNVMFENWHLASNECGAATTSPLTEHKTSYWCAPVSACTVQQHQTHIVIESLRRFSASAAENSYVALVIRVENALYHTAQLLAVRSHERSARCVCAIVQQRNQTRILPYCECVCACAVVTVDFCLISCYQLFKTSGNNSIERMNRIWIGCQTNGCFQTRDADPIWIRATVLVRIMLRIQFIVYWHQGMHLIQIRKWFNNRSGIIVIIVGCVNNAHKSHSHNISQNLCIFLNDVWFGRWFIFSIDLLVMMDCGSQKNSIGFPLFELCFEISTTQFVRHKRC